MSRVGRISPHTSPNRFKKKYDKLKIIKLIPLKKDLHFLNKILFSDNEKYKLNYMLFKFHVTNYTCTKRT